MIGSGTSVTIHQRSQRSTCRAMVFVWLQNRSMNISDCQSNVALTRAGLVSWGCNVTGRTSSFTLKLISLSFSFPLSFLERLFDTVDTPSSRSGTEFARDMTTSSESGIAVRGSESGMTWEEDATDSRGKGASEGAPAARLRAEARCARLEAEL